MCHVYSIKQLDFKTLFFDFILSLDTSTFINFVRKDGINKGFWFKGIGYFLHDTKHKVHRYGIKPLNQNRIISYHTSVELDMGRRRTILFRIPRACV